MCSSDLTPEPKVEYAIARPPFPDQREPKAKLDVPLWKHDGSTWAPAVPAPRAATVKALAAIASTGFSVSEWSGASRSLDLSGEELLAVVAHASAPPKLFDAFDWVQRMQIAACLAMAGKGDGWAGSERRRLLFGVALGPVDWSVTASLLALAHIAETEPLARPEIEALFGYLHEQAGQPGFTCYAAPLATLWIRMGKLSKARQKELAAWGRAGWNGGSAKPHTKAERAALMRRRKVVTARDLGSAALFD